MRNQGVLFALTFLCLLLLPAGPIFAESPAPEPYIPLGDRLMKRLETGFNDPFGFHYYFRDGFRSTSPDGHLKTKVGGEMRLDGGYIGANEILKSAFTGLPGWKGDFRELKLRLSGSLYEDWKFQFDMDFANVRQIRDIWLSYGKIPFLGEAKAGHTKVPFSLEGFMSNSNRTFMENALPVEAFFPGRNLGILCQNAVLNGRMTWAAGYFLISGSFSDVTDRKSVV